MWTKDVPTKPGYYWSRGLRGIRVVEASPHPVFHELRYGFTGMREMYHPDELRELSGHCGDEDYVALVPKTRGGDHLVEVFFGENYMVCNPFGVSGIERHEMPDGSVVFIGAHA